MNNKKIILTFIPYYLPGYKSGGPVRTISNMVTLLNDTYSFRIITKDRDQLDIKPYENIKVNNWSIYNNETICYSNHLLFLPKLLADKNFDVYYLNSLFSYRFSIKIMLLRKLKLIPNKKILLAPRGELSNGALSLKTLKKRSFLLIAKFSGLYNEITWHASSRHEAGDIRKQFGEAAKIRTAVDVPSFNNIHTVQRKEKSANTLRILFISSIVKMKNLRFVIQTLNKVKGDFILDIYGPVKDKSYWTKCRKLISPEIKNQITYKGIIPNTQINTVYPEYDLFFFPTLGENFGHVIFESLAYGTPVLNSDTTLWKGLESFNAGWNINLNEINRYVEIIEQLISTHPKEYRKYIDGCADYLEWFNREYTIAEDNYKLFT